MPAAYPLTKNPRRNYYTTRNKPIFGIVLHVTAGLQDLDVHGDDVAPRRLTPRFSQFGNR